MEDLNEIAGSDIDEQTSNDDFDEREGETLDDDENETKSGDQGDEDEKKEKRQASKSNTRSDSKSVRSSERSGGEAKEGDEKTHEESAPEKLTASEVEAISKKLGLPKEIKPILNKEGELRFVVPIAGKKYLATAEEVFKGFNINQAGHMSLQQAKQREQQVKQYFDSIKENPNRLWEIAEKLGHDKYALAEQLLKGYVEESSLSEEEKLRRQEIEEAKAIKAENERFKKEQAERAHQEAVNKQKDTLGQELVKAMTEHGFKPFNPNEDPKDKRTKCSIMASAIGKQLLAHQHGKNLSISDAVYLARQEWKDSVLSVFDDIDDNHIVDIIPERIIKAIRKADVARLRGDTPTQQYGQKLDLQEYNEARPRRPKKKTGLNEYFSGI